MLKPTNLNVLKIAIHCVAFWNVVSLIKGEIWPKHVFTEPNLSKCVQQPLIKVISDSASILDLSNHVADSGPGHTLGVFTVFTNIICDSQTSSYIHHHHINNTVIRLNNFKI